MVVLWPRYEVLQFGILSFGKGERLPELSYTWNQLKKFISRAKSKGYGYYPRLKYSMWRTVATGKLRMTEEQAWLFFETFDAISEVDKESRTSVNQSLLRCKSEEERGDVKANMSVDLLQFVIYLGVHLSDRPSLLSSPTDTMKTKWPVLSERSRIQGDDVHQMATLNNCLPKILEMLAEPGRGSLSREAELSLESVKALGLLVGGVDNDDVVRPLEDLASLQSEIKESGYSKLTMMFKLHYLLSWIQFYLDKNPYGSSAIMGGDRDKKCTVFRSAKRGKVMTNASKAPSEDHRLIFFHASNQTICKGPGSANGSVVDIQRCRNSYIYILAPLKFVSIEKCSNCVVVLGPVERMVLLEACEGVTVTAVCRKLHISKTEGSTFYVHTPTHPVILVGSSGLTLAPYNSHYPQLEKHAEESMLDVKSVNQWDNPVVIAEGLENSIWSKMPPGDFQVLDVPFDVGPGDTRENPVPLPRDYKEELEARDGRLQSWSETVLKANLTTEQEAVLQELVHDKFKEWLETTGHDREVSELHGPHTSTKAV